MVVVLPSFSKLSKYIFSFLNGNMQGLELIKKGQGQICLQLRMYLQRMKIWNIFLMYYHPFKKMRGKTPYRFH